MSQPDPHAGEDIVMARREELRRHRRERDALEIATIILPYEAADRAWIRARAQHLLRCKDEPATVALTTGATTEPINTLFGGTTTSASRVGDQALAAAAQSHQPRDG